MNLSVLDRISSRAAALMADKCFVGEQIALLVDAQFTKSASRKNTAALLVGLLQERDYIAFGERLLEQVQSRANERARDEITDELEDAA